MPNARHEPRLEAGAQRTLEGVGSIPVFGPGIAEQPCKGTDSSGFGAFPRSHHEGGLRRLAYLTPLLVNRGQKPQHVWYDKVAGRGFPHD
jgi:hypothetical protein